MTAGTRRSLLGAFALGAAALLTDCRDRSGPAIPPPRPGPAQLTSHTRGTRRIALTIDDGYDAATVAAYVKLCEDSGLHITFNPVGILATTWERHAQVLRPLIERGQVQIGNHTYHHHVLTALSDQQVRDELEMNEEWIEKTFGITSRPYFRPPGGVHDARIDDISGRLGYTRILMWEGSFTDSRPVTREQLLAAAQSSLHPGAVILGHANEDTVTTLYPEILKLIADRRLQPSTLDEMFGTNRATGGGPR